MYQRIVKIRLGALSSLRKAGTHNHRALLYGKGVYPHGFNTTAAAYGSLLSQGRRRELIQIDIEFIRPVAADQRQFERGAFRAGAGRPTIEFEDETLHPGRAVLDQL